MCLIKGLSNVSITIHFQLKGVQITAGYQMITVASTNIFSLLIQSVEDEITCTAIVTW